MRFPNNIKKILIIIFSFKINIVFFNKAFFITEKELALEEKQIPFKIEKMKKIYYIDRKQICFGSL